MIKVAATVKADRLRETDRFLELTLCVELCLLLKQVVKIVHVGAMMFAVVEVQKVARDNWLECADLIGQVLKSNSTGLFAETS